jgi:hypothetical protein
MKEFLRRYYRKHGPDGWVAQFDIHGYYPNMRHDVAEENFRKKLPEWAYERVVRILRDQYEGDTGYNPGSQLIQIAGISLLNDLDHRVKERLRVRFYIRYMDDLIMIHHDREFLEKCMEDVRGELRKIGFEVNEKKTRIYPLADGIPFLGFRFRVTETGKVLMIPYPAKIKTARKKYRRLAHKARRAAASARLGRAAKTSVGFDFPFRWESLAAFRWAAEKTGDWKFRYLTALVLASRGLNAQADAQLEACAGAVDDVSALLYRAGRREFKLALEDLEKARKLGEIRQDIRATLALLSTDAELDETSIEDLDLRIGDIEDSLDDYL